jgi:5-methylcytosine-specific restriction endonuclease McrA
MRRVRKAGNGGSHTADEVKYLKEIQSYQCLMCHKFEPEITLTLDHILPISKGGGDGIGNCQMLCKSCNSSKNAKFIDFRRTKPSKTIPTNRRVTTSERV